MTRRLPVLTLCVWLATAAVTTAQFFVPWLLPLLRRQPSMLEELELWRFVTSWLVHDGGATQIVVNFSALAVAGTLAEWLVPASLWIAAYIGGGLAGEVAGIAWQPVGAGNSVAILGLVGVLVVWQSAATGRPAIQRFPGLVIALLAALALVAIADIHGPALLAGIVLGIAVLRPAWSTR